MAERIEDIIEFRKKKLEALKAQGIDPYPSSTARDHTNAEALGDYAELFENKTKITVAGRIRSLRVQGKVAFAHIEDASGKLQIFFKADNLADKFKLLEYFDLGDFIEATGVMFQTKTEERTLEVQEFRMLSKSLRPLPSEHYGLADMEIRLRQRYLDLLMNPEVREMFIKKSKFWASMQKFLVDRDFLQIEAPVLEAVPGGAEAEPFITHHNALGRDFYLRIALELPLKKLIVGGYEKVFEIGRIFRNEGISTTHLQDYTQMEFYWAYADFEMLKKMLQEMYQYIIQETFDTLILTSSGVEVDWSGDWQEVDYFAIFKEHTGIDLDSVTDDQLKAYADSQHIKYESFAGRGRLIDLIFKKVRAKIPSTKPVFLVNQPIELEPLAKRDPKNPKVVQRLQILAYGTELGKGFGELNDPIDQRSRFEDQMKLRQQGDNEAQMLDEDYLEAMEYGMPPLAGFGVSERLFALLVDKSVRETVIFPPMKD
ncbi:MAG: Lysyl-tRNA synthetase [Candidatus Doudnabacteria bacterium]|nr:Lysyl-tRNA synthetase [Candidatus Doudnabacteria bacterium]